MPSLAHHLGQSNSLELSYDQHAQLPTTLATRIKTVILNGMTT
ncbi:MAG: hypothetical protein Q3971_07170 [Moraxella sp.]|nr:hypothetical protein [Moraxella sp.]